MDSLTGSEKVSLLTEDDAMRVSQATVANLLDTPTKK